MDSSFAARGRGWHRSFRGTLQRSSCPPLKPLHTRRPLARPDASATSANVMSSQETLVQETMAFLKEDLTHLFDDQGIDVRRYDDVVDFRDPITNVDSIQGYLANIRNLRRWFDPEFILHDIRQSGPYEITTRWTMNMRLAAVDSLPPLKRVWSPGLVFTGVSIYGINPENARINRHIDYWDSVEDQAYFSVEAFQDVLQQMSSLQAPALMRPEYSLLKRRKAYQIRRYDPCVLVPDEQALPQAASPRSESCGSRRGAQPAGRRGETSAAFSCSDGVGRRVLEEGKRDAKAVTSSGGVVLGGLYLCVPFGGQPTEHAIEAQRASAMCWVRRDGFQKRADGLEWLVAQHSRAGATPAAAMRNEILMPITEASFDLWAAPFMSLGAHGT